MKKSTTKKATITSKTVYTMQISPDFYVEADQTGKDLNFWLCRSNKKIYMFNAVTNDDVPSGAKAVRGALKELEGMITNPKNNNMRFYCISLLDEGEKLVDESFEIVTEKAEESDEATS